MRFALFGPDPSRLPSRSTSGAIRAQRMPDSGAIQIQFIHKMRFSPNSIQFKIHSRSKSNSGSTQNPGSIQVQFGPNSYSIQAQIAFHRDSAQAQFRPDPRPWWWWRLWAFYKYLLQYFTHLMLLRLVTALSYQRMFCYQPTLG